MLLLAAAVAVAASVDESCAGAEDGTCLLQLRTSAERWECKLQPVELRKTAKFCRLDGELISMRPLGDGAVQAVACNTASCCSEFAAATASCSDKLAQTDVTCEETEVGEEDLDFAWLQLPTEDLEDLDVDLPGDKFSFADVAMPCSFVARETRARRVFPEDTPEEKLMAMPLMSAAPPIPTPTPSPTAAPTPPAHPCEDGSHGCDAASELCVRDGAGFRCDCAAGFARTSAASSCVRTAAPTPAPTAPVYEYEGCQIQGSSRSYRKYGQGKCVYLDGRDFGKLPGVKGYKYLHKAGSSRCKSTCDADAGCCGYSVSRYQNCLMWYRAIRKQPGHQWGNAACMVKR